MRQVTLHTFRMGDVEDPEIYVAAPIYEWQQTEAGIWAMTHAKDPTFTYHYDMYNLGYKVVITGELEESDYTYYLLKYNANSNI